jgi:hypothetical protein
MDFKNDIHLSLEASVNIVLKVHHKQLVAMESESESESIRVLIKQYQILRNVR